MGISGLLRFNCVQSSLVLAWRVGLIYISTQLCAALKDIFIAGKVVNCESILVRHCFRGRTRSAIALETMGDNDEYEEEHPNRRNDGYEEQPQDEEQNADREPQHEEEGHNGQQQQEGQAQEQEHAQEQQEEGGGNGEGKEAGDDDVNPLKIFIGGVNWSTTEDGLRMYFKKFGEVLEVTLMKDKYTGQPRGFGFVEFATQDGTSCNACSSPSSSSLFTSVFVVYSDQ